jgi:hypothetical protein
MGAASAARCIGTICALAAAASSAAAIEFWEDRIAIHGYYEQQIRSIVRDYSFDDDWDLTQWYHVLNLEIEADLLPEGFGPFDLVSAFGRIEVRYDCVWNRGCGIFSGADAYGDRANRLPKRLLNGRRSGYTLQEFTGDIRRYREYDSFEFNSPNYSWLPNPRRRPLQFGFIPGPGPLSRSKGVDRVLGTWDDPFPFYTGGSLVPGFESGFMDPDDCKFGVQATQGPTDGVSQRNLPWTPKCRIEPIEAVRSRCGPRRSGATRTRMGAGTWPRECGCPTSGSPR